MSRQCAGWIDEAKRTASAKKLIEKEEAKVYTTGEGARYLCKQKQDKTKKLHRSARVLNRSFLHENITWLFVVFFVCFLFRLPFSNNLDWPNGKLYKTRQSSTIQFAVWGKRMSYPRQFVRILFKGKQFAHRHQHNKKKRCPSVISWWLRGRPVGISVV